MARRVPGAFLWGILASTAIGVPARRRALRGSRQPAAVDCAPTLLQLDVRGAFAPEMVAVVFVFFFLALFDSVGTLVGVGQQAGLMRDGTLPRARQALLADAIGTVAGAMLGTSTVTAYIESGAGVAAGGRTGLASLVTASLFLLVPVLLSRSCAPIGGGLTAGGTTLYPVIARAAGARRHDDDGRPAPRRVGRPDRGDSGVSDDHPDAACRQHHRGRRVRGAVVRALEADVRASQRRCIR